jgi:acyl-CoA reductase-like NAD-dependent aldehyde dehydrogenase
MVTVVELYFAAGLLGTANIKFHVVNRGGAVAIHNPNNGRQICEIADATPETIERAVRDLFAEMVEGSLPC